MIDNTQPSLFRLIPAIDKLCKEVQLDYQRSMNKITFDRVVGENPRKYPFVKMEENAEEIIPNKGVCICRTLCNSLVFSSCQGSIFNPVNINRINVNKVSIKCQKKNDKNLLMFETQNYHPKVIRVVYMFICLGLIAPPPLKYEGIITTVIKRTGSKKQLLLRKKINFWASALKYIYCEYHDFSSLNFSYIAQADCFK